MVNAISYASAVAILPVLIAWAMIRQPTLNRRDYSGYIVAMHLAYSISCLLTPDEYYGWTYIIAAFLCVIAIDVLSKSERDGAWCERIGVIMVISVPINCMGLALWWLGESPALYNIAMMGINALMLRAIMIDGGAGDRLDESAVVGRYYSLDFLPRLSLLRKNEA